MGIAGSGQSSIAKIAAANGFEVSGCDLKTEGHNISHLQNIDILAVTPAVYFQSSQHPELVEAQKMGIVMTGQEFMGNTYKRQICHWHCRHPRQIDDYSDGRTASDVAGLKPSVFVGAHGSHFGRVVNILSPKPTNTTAIFSTITQILLFSIISNWTIQNTSKILITY